MMNKYQVWFQDERLSSAPLWFWVFRGLSGPWGRCGALFSCFLQFPSFYESTCGAFRCSSKSSESTISQRKDDIFWLKITRPTTFGVNMLLISLLNRESCYSDETRAFALDYMCCCFLFFLRFKSHKCP